MTEQAEPKWILTWITEEQGRELDRQAGAEGGQRMVEMWMRGESTNPIPTKIQQGLDALFGQ